MGRKADQAVGMTAGHLEALAVVECGRARLGRDENGYVGGRRGEKEGGRHRHGRTIGGGRWLTRTRGGRNRADAMRKMNNARATQPYMMIPRLSF